MTHIYTILSIVGTLLFIGFFAGYEIAFVTANRLSIELKKKQGKRSGAILAQFIESPARFIGTCLIETGSRMDDLIYEEFKGTGNMELHLTRKLADRRIFPAIDVSRSGTRQEELLYSKEALPQIHTLRRMLEMFSDEERTETLLERLKKAETNEEFLDSLKTA